MSTQRTNQVQSPVSQYLLETLSGAKNSLCKRVNTLASFVWKQLDPSSQRYLQLFWNRDAAQFVGVKSYDKTLTETLGDWMLYPAIDLPKLSPIQKSHLAVALAASAVTLFFVKFFAYPGSTAALVLQKIAFLPHTCYTVAKFCTKFFAAGFAFRCFGRNFNPSLMKHFYTPESK